MSFLPGWETLNPPPVDTLWLAFYGPVFAGSSALFKLSLVLGAIYYSFIFTKCSFKTPVDIVTECGVLVLYLEFIFGWVVFFLKRTLADNVVGF